MTKYRLVRLLRRCGWLIGIIASVITIIHAV